jgi:PST family polysaccharide transporter
VDARKLITGTAAIAAANLLRVGLQFCLLPVLARLLGPEAYGLVALAMPVVLLAMLIGDAGLGSTLVRASDPDGRLEATVFWASTGVGVALTAGLALAAPLIAAGLTEPPLAPVLRALAPVLLLSALCTVPAARLQRAGRFSAFALGDVASTVAGMAVALWGATHGWGAWSLVAQQLVLWGVKFASGAVLSRLPVSIRFSASLLGPHVRFGLALLGANLVSFAARYADALLVGSVIGVKAVGIYALAVQFMRVPEVVLSGPVYTSVFPTVAATAEDRERVAGLWVSTLRVMLILALPAMVGLALTAQSAVELFLGPKWGGLAPVLAVLAPVGAVFCLAPVNAAVLVGLGRSDVQFRVSSLITALYLAGVGLGLPFGVEGVAVGCAAGGLVAMIPSFLVTARTVGVARPGLSRALLPPAAATAAMAVVVVLVEVAARGRPAGVLLALSVVAGALSYASVLGLSEGRRLRDDMRRLSLFGGRRSAAPPAAVAIPE